MDAIIMPSMLSLISKLQKDFPTIKFETGKRFSWSPERDTVFYDETDADNLLLLLHELSHGVLGHKSYQKDVQLLSMEATAWDKALELAKQYDVTPDQDAAQDNLDTYRDWLHARSTCPQCQATGFQKTKNTYECVACSHIWRVNEARLCALRRYSITK